MYVYGPENVEALFALVLRQGRADSSGIRLASDLYLEIEHEKVDRVIENEPDHARFFAGVVVWRPGELEAEIENDFWYVQDTEADLVLRKSTSGLWEELVKRIDAIETPSLRVPICSPSRALCRQHRYANKTDLSPRCAAA